MGDPILYSDDVSVDLVQGVYSDASVVLAARVSTLGEASTALDDKRDAGLINYLIRDRHGSPFEHNSFTFRVKAPIPPIREYMRHRIGWSYNEESGRYRTLLPEFYVISADRNLVQSGKVGHYTFSPGSMDQVMLVQQEMKDAAEESYARYERLLDAGIAREVARYVLSMNIYSTFYATCNARSLMAFLSLRTEHADATYPSHPMREIAMIADKIEAHFAAAMPLTYAAYVKNGRVAP